jgi:maltose O-acetyltransferase
MKHKFLLVYSWFIRTILFFFPDFPIFMRLRGWLYGLGLKKCGYDFQVTNDCILKGLENISVGNNVFLGNHSIFFGSGETYIGDGVMFGPHVVVVSGNHIFEGQSYRKKGSSAGLITIESGAWVGANCTIIAGSCLPKYSVLGANSLLSSVFTNERVLIAGSPARIIKNLND